MKEAILNYIGSRKTTVTFAELSRNIEGFKGTDTYMHEVRNIVLWKGISAEAIDAMQELIEEKQLAVNTTSILTYLNAGCVPSLPIATQIVTPYNLPHWWPIVIGLSAKGESTFPLVAGEDARYFSDDECVGKKG